MNSKKTASSKKSRPPKKQTEIVPIVPSRSRGQPTAYDPKFCDDLVEHMGKGLSFESFAGKCNVCFKTLYNWAKLNPEFLQAKADGEAKGLETLESAGAAGMYGQAKVDFRFWQLKMKVRFGKQGWNPDKHSLGFNDPDNGFDFEDDDEGNENNV